MVRRWFAGQRGGMGCWVLGLVGMLFSGAMEHGEAQSATTVAALSGGTYKYGHIYWRALKGNSVEFTLEAVFKRSNPTEFFVGTAPDGFSQVGDTITLSGREQPRFYFGDDSMVNVVRLRVTAYSEQEDWVMGETTMKHTYSTPSDGPRPWVASFRGCCRFSELENNKNQEWVIAAEVDLNAARESPRARILPVVSVPFRPEGVGHPKIVVPAASQSNQNAVEWSLAKPWDVGNAAYFSRTLQSFMSVPMQPLFNGDSVANVPGFSDVQTRAQCPGDPSNPNMVGPGCLYRLLRTDVSLKALTVEGWVKIQTPSSGGPPGGVVVSLGQDNIRPGLRSPDVCQIVRADGATASRDYVNVCMMSTLYIKVNETHVTVGHDLDRPSAGGSYPYASKKELSFSICSHADLCAETDGTLLDKWTHVAVQRYQRGAATQTPNSKWYHTYRVIVNGHVLEVAKYPGGPRPGLEVEIDYDPGESGKIEGPRAGRDVSCTVTCGPGVPWECGCSEDFAQGSALIFGAYKGAAGPFEYFEGLLDEWRFWHGYRAVSEIVYDIKRKLRPDLNQAYGSPTDPSLVVNEDKSQSRVSALMALYNFDQNLAAPNTCGLSGLSGCALADLMPAFPTSDDARITSPGVQLYKAYGSNVVSAPTDNTGTVFYNDGGLLELDYGNLTLTVPQPGLYQVMVLVSMSRGVAKVPVDFIVNVLDASYDLTLQTYKTCTHTPVGSSCGFPGNQYLPSLTVMARVQPLTTWSAKMMSEGSAPMSDIERFLFPCSVKVMVGFQAQFTFVGTDMQPNKLDFTRPYDWRDTNVGFSTGPLPPSARFTTVKGTNPSSMDLLWVPCGTDLGMKTICFESVDRHINRSTGVIARSSASGMKCVQIEVLPDPAPYFVMEGDANPKDATFTIGRQGSFMLESVDDNCLDTVTMSGKGMPPGAVLEAVDVDSTGAGCAPARLKFVFTPNSKLGGYNQNVCFEAADSGGMCEGGEGKHVTEHCVRVQVLRCVYALGFDEQLQDIGARFGMDWMRLWSLNPAIPHPDFILHMGQNINVGHLLRTDTGTEMAGNIAKRMGMSSQLLQDLNYGLDFGKPLELGQILCVVPDSCKGMARTAIGDLYRDGAT